MKNDRSDHRNRNMNSIIEIFHYVKLSFIMAGEPFLFDWFIHSLIKQDQKSTMQ